MSQVRHGPCETCFRGQKTVRQGLVGRPNTTHKPCCISPCIRPELLFNREVSMCFLCLCASLLAWCRGVAGFDSSIEICICGVISWQLSYEKPLLALQVAWLSLRLVSKGYTGHMCSAQDRWSSCGVLSLKIGCFNIQFMYSLWCLKRWTGCIGPMEWTFRLGTSE